MHRPNIVSAEGWMEGCPSCSLLADHLDASVPHLVATRRIIIFELPTLDAALEWAALARRAQSPQS